MNELTVNEVTLPTKRHHGREDCIGKETSYQRLYNEADLLTKVDEGTVLLDDHVNMAAISKVIFHCSTMTRAPVLHPQLTTTGEQGETTSTLALPLQKKILRIL